MKAYTAYQYISHRLASASDERAFVWCPAARTRLHRVVANRPARGGGEGLSDRQTALELGEKDCRRLRPRRTVERERAGKEWLEPLWQMHQPRVRGRAPHACVAGEGSRCERMRPA